MGILPSYIIPLIICVAYLFSETIANKTMAIDEQSVNRIPIIFHNQQNFTQVEIIKVMEGELQEYVFNLNITDDIYFLKIDQSSNYGMKHINIVEPNEIDKIIIISSSPQKALDKNQKRNYVGHIVINGYILGPGELEISLLDENENVVEKTFPIKIEVTRVKTIWEKLFVASVVILISIAYVNMACAIDLQIVKKTLKRPVAPAIGLVSQYLFMPLCSFGLGYALLTDHPELWLGLFLTGCSPGGGGSNIWTYLLGGSLDLSITMTFISTIVAYLAFPLWVYGLGRYIPLYYDTIQMPYVKIATFIIGLIIPIVIGLLIRRFSTSAADFLKKMLKPVAFFFIIFVCGFGIFAYSFIFYFCTWKVLLAGMLLPWLGFLFGFIVSKLTNQSIPDMKAICIETGIQNSGLAIGVLQVALHDEGPTGDIGLLMPILVSVMIPVPLFIWYIIQYFKSKKRNNEEVGLTGFSAPP